VAVAREHADRRRRTTPTVRAGDRAVQDANRAMASRPRACSGQDYTSSGRTRRAVPHFASGKRHADLPDSTRRVAGQRGTDGIWGSRLPVPAAPTKMTGCHLNLSRCWKALQPRVLTLHARAACHVLAWPMSTAPAENFSSQSHISSESHRSPAAECARLCQGHPSLRNSNGGHPRRTRACRCKAAWRRHLSCLLQLSLRGTCNRCRQR